MLNFVKNEEEKKEEEHMLNEEEHMLNEKEKLFLSEFREKIKKTSSNQTPFLKEDLQKIIERVIALSYHQSDELLNNGQTRLLLYVTLDLIESNSKIAFSWF